MPELKVLLAAACSVPPVLSRKVLLPVKKQVIAKRLKMYVLLRKKNVTLEDRRLN